MELLESTQKLIESYKADMARKLLSPIYASDAEFPFLEDFTKTIGLDTVIQHSIIQAKRFNPMDVKEPKLILDGNNTVPVVEKVEIREKVTISHNHDDTHYEDGTVKFKLGCLACECEAEQGWEKSPLRSHLIGSNGSKKSRDPIPRLQID